MRTHTVALVLMLLETVCSCFNARYLDNWTDVINGSTFRRNIVGWRWRSERRHASHHEPAHPGRPIGSHQRTVVSVGRFVAVLWGILFDPLDTLFDDRDCHSDHWLLLYSLPMDAQDKPRHSRRLPWDYKRETRKRQRRRQDKAKRKRTWRFTKWLASVHLGTVLSYYLQILLDRHGMRPPFFFFAVGRNVQVAGLRSPYDMEC